MKQTMWIVIAWLVPSFTGHAASFDCAKAGTKVEHMICDNPDISKLDEELSAAYKTALQDKQQADSIKQAQKQWMKERDVCADASCVKHAYEKRLSSVAGMHRTSGEGTVGNAAKTIFQNTRRYHFQITKGSGTPACDAYLERLNTSKYEKPPFCDRPENDAVKGFARLNRMPLSSTDIRDLYPIVKTFWWAAKHSDFDWKDPDLQRRLTISGQFVLSDAELKYLQRDMDKGWAKVWQFVPPVDIDNDGLPDNIEIWNGTTLSEGVGGRQCGDDVSDIFQNATLLRQPQVAFVVSGNDRLDISKTTKVFAHPSGGYALSKGGFSTHFRPIGKAVGIFKYQDTYYFDTLFDSWGDFENKRANDKNIGNTLAVFLNKEGETKQVCEYLMMDEGQKEGETK